MGAENFITSSSREASDNIRASIEEHEAVQGNDGNPLKESDPSVEKTPKRCKKAKMSEYEEKLYELNKSRIEETIRQSKELHQLKMKHEVEYHKERLRLLRNNY